MMHVRLLNEQQQHKRFALFSTTIFLSYKVTNFKMNYFCFEKCRGLSTHQCFGTRKAIIQCFIRHHSWLNYKLKRSICAFIKQSNNNNRQKSFTSAAATDQRAIAYCMRRFVTQQLCRFAISLRQRRRH